MSAPVFDPARPDDYAVVAAVTRAFHCANRIRKGETFVFDLAGRIDPERSTANLCLGILARLQPALLMAQDRAAEGLHPVSRTFRTFDCFDTGIDHGGTGKVFVELCLVDRATGARIPRPDEVAPEPADARPSTP